MRYNENEKRYASTYLSDVEPFKTVTFELFKNNRTRSKLTVIFIVILTAFSFQGPILYY